MGYEERESSLVFFVVHGGGYMLGEARYEDPRNIDLITDFSSALLADKSCGVITISPEYRLAPEHPFPAGRDDVLTALRETMRRHRGAPLFLMGDSAGAGLVYQALQALEDEELARVSGVLALEPCLNPLLVSASSYDYRDAPVWPRPTAAISWGHYQAGGAQPWQVCRVLGLGPGAQRSRSRSSQFRRDGPRVEHRAPDEDMGTDEGHNPFLHHNMP